MKKGIVLLHKENDIEMILQSDGLTRLRPFTDPERTVYYYASVPAALSGYIRRKFDKADFSGRIEEEITFDKQEYHPHPVAHPSPSDVSNSR